MTTPHYNFAGVSSSLSTAGYAVCRQLVPPWVAAQLRRRCLQLVDDFQPSNTHTVFSTDAADRTNDQFFMSSGDVIRFFLEKNVQKEDGSLNVDKLSAVNKIGHALHEQDDVFRRFSTSLEILRLSEAIGYKRPTVVQSMYILKQAHTGGAVTPHQDGCFLFSEPQTVMGAWFAIDDASKENGCLHVVPVCDMSREGGTCECLQGSHKQQLHKSRYKRLSDNHCGFDVEPTYSTEGAGSTHWLHCRYMHCGCAL
eukprot:GHVS01081433.1.p1 GENE.GHVS01081433.1~~GHVS01081433.1.p1  ORF type:complete len:254 (+),score=41.18 GHVS01081433.1:320-1081(+)